ncbi:helix-turn-helix domain-containing protein [Nocardia amamiensis]|uniref:Helix-turn-helix domain-containing protein n=1 Tax=Nocardia amamiensis TaxID=404578 RepID=A0ABS0CYV8_9NOCA|nr:helix-turn-helix domain-containing protein [Nocardia amamiensis]MBF6301023.1 helix-turn-helix domain-containing protein [Nocardia amamiensis]
MTALIEPPVNGSAAVARTLLVDVDELSDELVGRIRTGDHAYAESTALTELQLRTVVRDNLVAVLGQLAGSSRRRLHPAAAVGRLKAEVGVPLAAVLHAYRLAGRLLWERSLTAAATMSSDALPQLGSEMWRVIDDFSSTAADAYGDYLAERARRDDLERESMLRSLFDGGADDRTLREIARALQLPPLGAFIVVHAEAGPEAAEPLPGIESRLRADFVHSVWLTEPAARVGLLNLATARAHERVLSQLRQSATGRVGVSRIFPTPGAAGSALREAELAGRCSRPGTPAVTTYGSTPIPLVLANAPGASRELADDILGPVLQLPPEDRDTLLDTLELWFECGGSNTEVAQRLHYHRNTVHYRLRRIETLTGRRCADPKSAAELYLALRATRLIGPDPA